MNFVSEFDYYYWQTTTLIYKMRSLIIKEKGL